MSAPSKVSSSFFIPNLGELGYPPKIFLLLDKDRSRDKLWLMYYLFLKMAFLAFIPKCQEFLPKERASLEVSSRSDLSKIFFRLSFLRDSFVRDSISPKLLSIGFTNYWHSLCEVPFAGFQWEMLKSMGFLSNSSIPSIPLHQKKSQAMLLRTLSTFMWLGWTGRLGSSQKLVLILLNSEFLCWCYFFIECRLLGRGCGWNRLLVMFILHFLSFLELLGSSCFLLFLSLMIFLLLPFYVGGSDYFPRREGRLRGGCEWRWSGEGRAGRGYLRVTSWGTQTMQVLSAKV